MREVLVEDISEEESAEAPLPEHGGPNAPSNPLSTPSVSKLFFRAPRGDRASTRWLYATVILCCYGFFKEFKPSEPFLTPYLVDFKNFTKDEVSSEIASCDRKGGWAQGCGHVCR